MTTLAAMTFWELAFVGFSFAAGAGIFSLCVYIVAVVLAVLYSAI